MSMKPTADWFLNGILPFLVGLGTATLAVISHMRLFAPRLLVSGLAKRPQQEGEIVYEFMVTNRSLFFDAVDLKVSAAIYLPGVDSKKPGRQFYVDVLLKRSLFPVLMHRGGSRVIRLDFTSLEIEQSLSKLIDEDQRLEGGLKRGEDALADLIKTTAARSICCAKPVKNPSCLRFAARTYLLRRSPEPDYLKHGRLRVSVSARNGFQGRLKAIVRDLYPDRDFVESKDTRFFPRGPLRRPPKRFRHRDFPTE
jgi:hypothetical protein